MNGRKSQTLRKHDDEKRKDNRKSGFAEEETFYIDRASDCNCNHYYPVIAEFLRASIFYSLIAIDLQLYGFVFGRKILCF